MSSFKFAECKYFQGTQLCMRLATKRSEYKFAKHWNNNYNVFEIHRFWKHKTDYISLSFVLPFLTVSHLEIRQCKFNSQRFVITLLIFLTNLLQNANIMEWMPAINLWIIIPIVVLIKRYISAKNNMGFCIGFVICCSRGIILFQRPWGQKLLSQSYSGQTSHIKWVVEFGYQSYVCTIFMTLGIEKFG